jgi:predicted neutral ceramidase superfamily lipid hydrolase
MMREFAVITNRKRARIALGHSIIFLLIAMRGAASAAVVNPILGKSPIPTPTFILFGVYLIVSTVLMVLARISRCKRERLYFLFCASSATIGLLRYLIGDPTVHVSLYLRVLMLTCAVLTGVIILRGHPASRAAEPAA